MSTQENVQNVKDFFAAIGAYNKQDLLALVATDIEWIIPGEDWPLAAKHRGHAELAAVLQKASEEIETTYLTPPEFVAQGDRVLVVGVATGKIKATSKPFKTIGSSILLFEMASGRRSGNISTHKPSRGPRRGTRSGWRSAGHLGRGRRCISRGSPPRTPYAHRMPDHLRRSRCTTNPSYPN